jgi:hypothetical protein
MATNATLSQSWKLPARAETRQLTCYSRFS